MKPNHFPNGWLTATLLLAGIAAGQAPPGDAYVLDLSALRRLDPAAIVYRQTRILKPGRINLRAVAALDGGARLALAGGRTLLLLDARGREEVRHELEFEPVALAAAPDGHLFLAASASVHRLSADGTTVELWRRLEGEPQLTSIAVSETRVWLADGANGRIHVFDRDGQALPAIGEQRDAQGGPHFILPSRTFDLAAAVDGTLWAVNPGRHRIENYRTDGSLASSWGRSGARLEAFCGCCNPSHLAVYPDGRFVTAEKGLTRVKLYDQQGRLVGAVAGPERLRDDGAGLDLAVADDGRVFVVDAAAGLLRVFAPNQPVLPVPGRQPTEVDR